MTDLKDSIEEMIKLEDKEYNEFDEWYHELENYGLRSERIDDILCEDGKLDYKRAEEWLKSAWEAGRKKFGRMLNYEQMHNTNLQEDIIQLQQRIEELEKEYQVFDVTKNNDLTLDISNMGFGPADRISMNSGQYVAIHEEITSLQSDITSLTKTNSELATENEHFRAEIERLKEPDYYYCDEVGIETDVNTEGNIKQTFSDFEEFRPLKIYEFECHSKFNKYIFCYRDEKDRFQIGEFNTEAEAQAALKKHKGSGDD